MLVAVAVAGAAAPARVAAQPSSFAPAAATAGAAVVTLKIPGRAALHGRRVNTWPRHDLLEDGDAGDLTLGSAVIVEGTGIAVTTARLGRRALLLEAVLADGRRVSAMIMGRDDETNLAVLSLCCAVDPLPTIALADSDRLRAGDWVLALGAPFGLGASATASVVSRVTSDEGDGLGRIILTGPSVSEGYAGGPLVDSAGAMVGLVVGNHRDAGIALPSNTIRTILTALLEEGRVRRGSLGIRGQTLDRELADAFGADPRGVVIVDVRRDSPGARAGLRPGDIVYELDGRPLDSATRLARAVGSLPPGRVVTLGVRRRGGDVRALDVRLGEEPDDDGVGTLRWRTRAVLGADVVAIASDVGVMVSKVEPGGPAARAGIRRADVIREVNGQAIGSLADFERALTGLTGRSPLVILLQRGASSLYVTSRHDDARRSPDATGDFRPW